MTIQLSDSAVIYPDWDAPGTIKALVTTRHGGCSKAPFEQFNLAEHVQDNSAHVQENRRRLRTLLPSEPVWLNQIHSHTVVDARSVDTVVDADGSYTTQDNVVCVVMTADCLPVLICNRQGNAVAALHAGWRGLLDGILEQGVEKMCQTAACTAEDLLVWFGPAIGSSAFEVGDEVRQAFLQKADKTNPQSREAINDCFAPTVNDAEPQTKKWLADIYQLARIRLSLSGIENFSGGNYCTYKDKETFYSYRRDGKTGRMASLIWIEK